MPALATDLVNDRVDAIVAAAPAAVQAAAGATTSIPVIASGGAGKPEDFFEVLRAEGPCADAALAASIFHYGTYTVADLKQYLAGMEIPIRP